MKKSVEDSVNELIAKAKKDGLEGKKSRVPRSSLHSLIKTRKQAEHFMVLLEFEKNKALAKENKQ